MMTPFDVLDEDAEHVLMLVDRRALNVIHGALIDARSVAKQEGWFGADYRRALEIIQSHLPIGHAGDVPMSYITSTYEEVTR